MLNLYCVTHKPIDLPKVPGLHTLQVGADKENFADLRDNTGDNIQHKNATWSENTAFYNIWKNRPSEFVGFCHYRRFLLPQKLSEQLQKSDGLHSSEHMTNYASGLLLDEKTLFDHISADGAGYCNSLQALLGDADILMPHSNPLPEGGLLKHYISHHPAGAFYELLALMSHRFPLKSKPIFDFFTQHKKVYWNNLFVMRWAQFEAYCEFLFPMLFELEKQIKLPEHPYQQRVFAFLSERLLNYWVHKEALNIKELDWCMTESIDNSNEPHQSGRVKQA